MLRVRAQWPACNKRFQRYLFDDLPERDKNEYELRSLAFLRQERLIYKEEMFDRACRRFEMNRFRMTDSTLKVVNWGEDGEMRLAFDQLDTNRDGYIKAEELGRYLSNWGAYLDRDDLDKMIRFADKDGDGKVSFREFTSMLRGEFDTPLGRIPRMMKPKPSS